MHGRTLHLPAGVLLIPNQLYASFTVHHTASPIGIANMAFARKGFYHTPKLQSSSNCVKAFCKAGQPSKQVAC